MPDVRFLQIHSLHGYSAALLNRDDSGLAKRITYGGRVRTRVSSQCLKRHWRMADDVHALQRIDGVTTAVRSHEGWLEENRYLNMDYWKEQKKELIRTAA